MNKSELLAKVAAGAGVDQREAEKVIDAFFSTITASTKSGDKVTWPGFGAFSVGHRAARTGRNPSTGATIEIAASNAMKFSAASALKSALNS